jgi:hypothetical protein
MVSLLLLLDFSKTFDKINHGRLLKKLRTFGLFDNAISWFASYLHDRAQCVSVGGKFSSWLDVNSGVPLRAQSWDQFYSPFTSIILMGKGGLAIAAMRHWSRGPFFFEVLKYCRHHLFADDYQIYYSFHPDDIDAAVGTVNEYLIAV